MPSRHLVQRLFVSACLVFALFGARPAWAAAPLCDVRGASVIAPTPVLPIQDVRLDATGCPEAETDVSSYLPGSSSRASIIEGIPLDGCARSEQAVVASARSDRTFSAPAILPALPPAIAPACSVHLARSGLLVANRKTNFNFVEPKRLGP